MNFKISSKMHNPQISVLLPVYNCEKYISTAIQSILDQTYSNFELIIINDCSTDNSEAQILSFDDSRIRYYKNSENLKLIETLNYGIQLSKGEYIARMDADDVSYPERFEKQINFLEKNKDVGVLGTSFKLISSEKELESRFNGFKEIRYPQQSGEIAFELIFNNVLLHPSVMLRKVILVENKINYDTNFIHAEEYHLWTELILKTKFSNLPDILIEYRVHDSQISHNFFEIQGNKALEIQNNYLVNLGISLSLKETEVFIHFLQGKKIETTLTKNLVKTIDIFINSIQSIAFIDPVYAMKIISKRLKNVLIDSNGFSWTDFIQRKLIRKSFYHLSIKQQIAFLIKLNVK